jgi:hypothetical protein
VVFWADASSVGALVAAYGEFAVALELATPEQPVPEAAAAFLRGLAGRSSWLVVLDNADDPDSLTELLQPNTAGHVLITTRDAAVDLGRMKPLALDVWPAEEATAFLRERSGRGEKEATALAELADELGGLPLALEQAGAYLARHKDAVVTYLESFSARRLATLKRQGPRRGPYTATVSTTWDLSFEKVAAASPAAAEALEACAFLHPDGIPLRFFTTSSDLLGPALGQLAAELEEDPLAVSVDLIEPLPRYSLLRYDPQDGGSFSVHRLVQEVVRERLEEAGRCPEVLVRVQKALAAHFPAKQDDPKHWPECALWAPHAQAGFEFWGRWGSEEEWNPTSLWIELAFYFWSVGRYTEARGLEEEALEVSRRVLGAEHPDTLVSMYTLCLTQRDMDEGGPDPELVAELLRGVRKLPPGVPIREAALEEWEPEGAEEGEAGE